MRRLHELRRKRSRRAYVVTSVANSSQTDADKNTKLTGLGLFGGCGIEVFRHSLLGEFCKGDK
jgi:hypothetical protein